MSSGRPRILIGTNSDGSIVLQYKPLETGNHDLSANFNEQSVEGTNDLIRMNACRFIISYYDNE